MYSFARLQQRTSPRPLQLALVAKQPPTLLELNHSGLCFHLHMSVFGVSPVMHLHMYICVYECLCACVRPCM